MASLVGLAALLILSISATEACSCWREHPQGHFCKADFGEFLQYAVIIPRSAHESNPWKSTLKFSSLPLRSFVSFHQLSVRELWTLRLANEITSALKFTTWRSRKSTKAKTQSRTHKAQSTPDQPTSRHNSTRRPPAWAVQSISNPMSSISWREP